jgi:hypothetical protein
MPNYSPNWAKNAANVATKRAKNRSKLRSNTANVPVPGERYYERVTTGFHNKEGREFDVTGKQLSGPAGPESWLPETGYGKSVNQGPFTMDPAEITQRRLDPTMQYAQVLPSGETAFGGKRRRRTRRAKSVKRKATRRR